MILSLKEILDFNCLYSALYHLILGSSKRIIQPSKKVL